MNARRESAAEAPEVVVYATDWCPQSRAAERFLQEHGIPHRAIDIDQDEAAAEHCTELNDGYRSTPTILINGEHAATEPSTAELRRLFNVESGGFNPARWLASRFRSSSERE